MMFNLKFVKRALKDEVGLSNSRNQTKKKTEVTMSS